MEQNESQTSQQTPEQTKDQGYTPRPAWQVWAARGAVVVFLVLVAIQILTIARGGL